MFELHNPGLQDVLGDAEKGRLQLPDFQRGWVWGEDAIASLIVSVVRSFPVGALLTLKTGGSVRFAPRGVEGVPELGREPDELLLDGQQRVTSLYQAFSRTEPVETRTARGKKREVFFYFDIERARQDPFPEDAVKIVRATKKVSSDNFGREVLHDLSTAEGEYEAMWFPANRVFTDSDWFGGWMKHWSYCQEKIELFQDFRGRVIESIGHYKLPIIRLSQDSTKEAVCVVFEKVNTSGKVLDAFELLTAMFAATGAVNLRTDWYGTKETPGRQRRLKEVPLFENIGQTARDIDRKDFLRAVSLAHTYGKRREAEAAGRELPAISCNRAALLELPAEAYEQWRDGVTEGFAKAAKFLDGVGIHWSRDLPYVSQVTALAALSAVRDNKPLSAGATKKLQRWFWCGVFGELYGSATETRIANDVEDLAAWLEGDTEPPRTIRDAVFSESRLDTLYSRNSAAYKGMHALLMHSGSKDFRTGKRIAAANRHSENFDIHHIFPRDWCEKTKPRITRARYNGIVNKTAISSGTNRQIGGSAPSLYCSILDKETTDAGVSLDDILSSHLIDPKYMREDNFDGFYAARKTALVDLIEREMDKDALRDGTGEAEDYEEEEELTAVRGTWQSLAKLLGVNITFSKPLAVKFPDGDRKDCIHWSKFYVAVVEWLVAKGHFAGGEIDQRLEKCLYRPHDPRRPPGNRSAKLSNGMWLNQHLSAGNIVEKVKLFVHVCGEDAEQFFVCLA